MPSIILISVMVLKQVTCDLGYNYPQAQPPVLLDEPSTPANVYLPPIFQEEIPPLPIPTYLPPVFYPPASGLPPLSDEDTVVLPPANPYPPPQMKILNMSCVMDSSFKSVFRVEGRTGSPPPVVDNGHEGCVKMEAPNVFRMDMDGGKKMAECGVRRCTAGASSRAHMCVLVRTPTVQGLKLPEDGLVNLQCTPQDTVASHTKHIRLGPTTINKGKSLNSAVVASGGSQRNFDSRLILLRKSPTNNFDLALQPGSVVQLGEELVLRAVVQDGDGWRFSRMGPVVVRSASTQKSISIVEENGCRSAGIKSICPAQPRQLTPLDTLLHFRAFLFQDSSRGDDMVLSVRMLGCVHAHDCLQSRSCIEDRSAPPLRFKRSSVALTAEENSTSNWESQFQFRVQTRPDENFPASSGFSHDFLLLASMMAFCLLLIIILFTLYCKSRNK